MDERRPADAAVTGVARGSLGTGTALDETQEWVIPEGLQANGPAASSAGVEATAEPVSPAAPVAEAAPVAQAAPVAEAALVASVASRPVAARSHASSSTPRTRGGFSPGPRTAGIAAVLLLGLVGVTAVVTSLDGNQAGTAPQAPAPSTTVPTGAPAEEADGNGGNKDKDKGNGNGKGRGNGGGRGND